MTMLHDRRANDEILDVVLHKGSILGLGFCIDGGKDDPFGPRPITIKRLFKGAFRFIMQCSICRRKWIVGPNSNESPGGIEIKLTTYISIL